MHYAAICMEVVWWLMSLLEEVLTALCMYSIVYLLIWELVLELGGQLYLLFGFEKLSYSSVPILLGNGRGTHHTSVPFCCFKIFVYHNLVYFYWPILNRGYLRKGKMAQLSLICLYGRWAVIVVFHRILMGFKWDGSQHIKAQLVGVRIICHHLHPSICECLVSLSGP